MESIGENITEYRRKLGLTQKDLGDMLNVSPQAVSKWENGQAEPDTSTIKKLCQIFKITTDELLGLTEPETEGETAVAAEGAAAPVAQAATPIPAPAPQVIVEQKIINGYCESCNKPVGPNEYIVTHSSGGRGHSPIQHLYCHECHAKMVKSHAQSSYDEHKRQTRKSIIWGAAAGVGAAAIWSILFIAIITITPIWASVIAAIVVGIGYFAFVMQVFWDGVVIDVFMFFIHSFRLPGVIFTLDLDGIFFLIAFKLLGAIVTGILSALFFILGLFITPIIALVVLPFAALKRFAEGKSLKKQVDNATRDVEKFAA